MQYYRLKEGKLLNTLINTDGVDGGGGDPSRSAIVFWRVAVPFADNSDHCYRLQPPAVIGLRKPDRLVVLMSIDQLLYNQPSHKRIII